MNSYFDRIVFGCHSIATVFLPSEAQNLLIRAHNLGIREFDTAPLYSQGYSEKLIGLTFTNLTNIKVTTKVGNYPVPHAFVSPTIALPLNKIKKGFNQNLTNTNLTQLEASQNESCLSPLQIEKHYQASKKRLLNLQIHNFLLHEIYPWELSIQSVNTLLRLTTQGNAMNLGYGGQISEDLLDYSVPHWLKVLQVPYPINNLKLEKKLRQWINKHPHVEVRLFGFFRGGAKPGLIAIAKTLLERYPNVKILFSCRSDGRLRENLSTLNGN
jgi:aryl-alcohol dehydrogenase-like predicted oxidoreductase